VPEPGLVREAQAAGFEAYHVAHLGLASSKDRELVAYAVARDLVLVTNNAGDFLRLYGALELHPGLVIIVPNTGRKAQVMLFRVALSRLRSDRRSGQSSSRSRVGSGELDSPRIRLATQRRIISCPAPAHLSAPSGKVMPREFFFVMARSSPRP
jgi:predicted nuclease of predicted toxin-antitoxin system